MCLLSPENSAQMLRKTASGSQASHYACESCCLMLGEFENWGAPAITTATLKPQTSHAGVCTCKTQQTRSLRKEEKIAKKKIPQGQLFCTLFSVELKITRCSEKKKKQHIFKGSSADSSLKDKLIHRTTGRNGPNDRTVKMGLQITMIII